MPNVGVLIVEDQTQVLDRKHQSKLPGIVGWNLIWLSYHTFVKKYGTSEFDSFTCLGGVDPLLFSQLCVYYHSNICKGHTLGVTTDAVSHQFQQSSQRQMTCLKKDQCNFINKTR